MTRVDSDQIRHSVIAGSWYPGAAAALRATVDGYLENVAKVDLEGDPIGLIVPHAGYTYSGQVAAYAYKQVQGLGFRYVVIVSPVHRMYVGRFAITAKRYYETPLGLVEVDSQLVKALEVQLDVNLLDYDNEHSLEIQLPFVQRVLPNAKLLPIMMGAQDAASCQALAKAIAQIVEPSDTLLVASTDLSHFYPYRRAKVLDQVFLNDVEAYDPDKLLRDLDERNTEACGGGPVATVMLAAQRLGANRGRILKYATSGDVTGDHSSVVGYAAGVLYKARNRG